MSGEALNSMHLHTLTNFISPDSLPNAYEALHMALYKLDYYYYKCKKLKSLKQCLTATRPTSHN